MLVVVSMVVALSMLVFCVPMGGGCIVVLFGQVVVGVGGGCGVGHSGLIPLPAAYDTVTLCSSYCMLKLTAYYTPATPAYSAQAASVSLHNH